MHSTFGTTRPAGLLPAILAGFIGLSAAFAAGAETVKTVNGVAIDSTVLEFYMQSRTNRPAAQVSAEERERLLTELTDIYLLTTQKSAAELSKDPQIAAQIELQRRGILAQAVASRFFEGATEYESQRALAPPLQFKARHILVESQGEATDIIKSLDEGADFVELATTKSTGPSGPPATSCALRSCRVRRSTTSTLSRWPRTSRFSPPTRLPHAIKLNALIPMS